jgi:peptidoglycan hydrolase CwlO-like protein
MTQYSAAIENLAQSVQRMMRSREGIVAEQQRHQDTIAKLQRQLADLNNDINGLNAAIVQLGGHPPSLTAANEDDGA